MDNSLRSYSKKNGAFRPLFFDFTGWRFYCKMSGRFQSESVAVFIGIRNNALKIFWDLLNNPCGKRLKPQLSRLVEKGITFGEVLISEEVREKLEVISSKKSQVVFLILVPQVRLLPGAN